MPRCFVIQPFDRGPFDQRFDEVLSPAITAAALEPYRVDRDPAVTIPIDAIESGIRDADACLADISTDNPNVWFELGYALACRKPLVMICSAKRTTRFPFDVQHRHITKYQTESAGDFKSLAKEVTSRLQAVLAQEESVQSLSQSGLVETEGLETHEIAALIIIAESALDVGPSSFSIKQDMTKAGYTELAAVLGVKTLQAKRLVTTEELTNFNGEPYLAYALTDAGTDWLQANRSRLLLRREPARRRPHQQAAFDDFPESLDQ